MMEYLEDHIDITDSDTWTIVFKEIKFRNLVTGLRSITASKVYEYKINVEALESLKKSIEKELGI